MFTPSKCYESVFNNDSYLIIYKQGDIARHKLYYEIVHSGTERGRML